MLNERALKDEVLAKLLTEIENVINNKHLTHVLVDHRDPKALTPNYFLLGVTATVVAPGKLRDEDSHLQK